jgi:prepilin-type N-terminal cleavage/methylation domain-containing protein
MRRSGFTITELLVVIAIIAIVSAIVMPLLAMAKVAGLETVEISQLRQLGQAREMYLSDSSTQECHLHHLAEYLPGGKALVSSPLDPDISGRSNRIAKSLIAPGSPDRSAPFRVSYVGAHTFGWTDDLVNKYLTGKPKRGWLLSFSRSRPDRISSEFDAGLRGRYLRLLLDGSVLRLSHDPKNFIIEGSEQETGDSPFFDFADWTNMEKNRMFKED